MNLRGNPNPHCICSVGFYFIKKISIPMPYDSIELYFDWSGEDDCGHRSWNYKFGHCIYKR